MLKWLVVGCGSIGRRHLANILALGETDVSVCRSGVPGSQPIEQENVKTFHSLDEALAEAPDVVIVSNPTSLHMPVALAAAKAGANLIIEKPLSDTKKDIDRLAELVESKRLTVMVAYNMRFHPALLAVRDLVARKAAGEPLAVRAWVGEYLPDWYPGGDYTAIYAARKELGGGVILTLSHELDYMYSLFGRVSEVDAVKSRTGGLDMSAESLAEITLLFGSGTVGHVHLDCLRRTPSRGCEIVCGDGTIVCDFIRQTVWIERPGKDEKETVNTEKVDRNQMYLDELTHFAKCVRSGETPECSLDDGIAVLDVALAAHRAAETGTRQTC